MAQELAGRDTAAGGTADKDPLKRRERKVKRMAGAKQ
jgi:hypothetical protein